MYDPYYFDSPKEFSEHVKIMIESECYIMKINDKLSSVTIIADTQPTLISIQGKVIEDHKGCKVISHAMAYNQHQTKWYMNMLCENFKENNRTNN